MEIPKVPSVSLKGEVSITYLGVGMSCLTLHVTHDAFFYVLNREGGNGSRKALVGCFS